MPKQHPLPKKPKKVPKGCRQDFKKPKPAFGRAGSGDNSWNTKHLNGRKGFGTPSLVKKLCGVEKTFIQLKICDRRSPASPQATGAVGGGAPNTGQIKKE